VKASAIKYHPVSLPGSGTWPRKGTVLMTVFAADCSMRLASSKWTASESRWLQRYHSVISTARKPG